MLGEVPRAILDKIAEGAPQIGLQKLESDSQITKGKQLFLAARGMIEPYRDEEEGTAEMGSLIMSVGKKRVWIELMLDKKDPKSYVLKTEVLPRKVGGERKELSVFIKEDVINWGEEKATEEQAEIALKLLAILGEDMPPPMDPWERKRIKDHMILGMDFVIREQELERWRNDPYD
jgi:hypothetical protein